MRKALWSAILAAGVLLAAGVFSPPPLAQEQASLRPASEFDSIADSNARSIALFEEAGKVLQHPRCVNCHPAGDRPLQGMAMRLHEPPVLRGDADFGKVGMTCNTCHGSDNVALAGQADDIKSIPGNPAWRLAPIEMAWQGKSLGEICAQIKDPARNGGKDLDQIVEHMAHDELVGWGWHPGDGRESAPGTQAVFGELIKYWVETGAVCPS
jgi:hypothetical protein